jgi:hypothetical protein
MARSRRYYVVMVEGSGQFPIDMLRYDRATPHQQSDASAIMEDGKRRLEVRMDDKPTVGRWESFGWRVLMSEPREM